MTASTDVSAADFLPAEWSLPRLSRAAAGCRGCELYRDATQTVFGKGPAHAALMLVGEQPGDVEDREGEPFVGPAGKLLRRALNEAGIDPDSTYLTNAVKHFRFQTAGSGARRLHKKPTTGHLRACRPWLQAELTSVSPRFVVALGATAAQSLYGTRFKLTQSRGRLLPIPEDFPGDHDRLEAVMATVHPSAVLRAPDSKMAYQGFLYDLKVVAGSL
jgi:DNA polymerase